MIDQKQGIREFSVPLLRQKQCKMALLPALLAGGKQWHTFCLEKPRLQFPDGLTLYVDMAPGGLLFNVVGVKKIAVAQVEASAADDRVGPTPASAASGDFELTD